VHGDVYSYISTSCGSFLRANLAIVRIVVVAIVAPLVVAACAGPNDGLVGGRLSWFDYVGGSDMQRSCSRSTLERYRLVFNAEYTKQVRTYDILQNGDGATLRGKVFRGGLSVDASFALAVEGLVGRAGEQPLSGLEFEGFKRAVAAAEPFLGVEAAYLRSDSYYWVALECRRGSMLARAFTGPKTNLEGLAFRRFLFAHDPTGVPVRVQRPVPADQLTGFGRAYSAMQAETPDRAAGRGGPLFQFKFEDGRIAILGG
jgi:hypothetical protein